MTVISPLRHTTILLISAKPDRELELSTALAAQGCVAYAVEPGARLQSGQRYDAALLCVQPNCRWSASLIAELQSSERACASLVLLARGGPTVISSWFRSGATDCLVRPVSTHELLESLALTVECTRRMRARFSLARTRVLGTPGMSSNAAMIARVFEPAEREGDIDITGDLRIERLVQRLSLERRLTPREHQVLYWLLLGYRNVDIASALQVALRTVKYHVSNLLTKLELDSRHDLSRLLAHEFSRPEVVDLSQR